MLCSLKGVALADFLTFDSADLFGADFLTVWGTDLFEVDFLMLQAISLDLVWLWVFFFIPNVQTKALVTNRLS